MSLNISAVDCCASASDSSPSIKRTAGASATRHSETSTKTKSGVTHPPVMTFLNYPIPIAAMVLGFAVTSN